MKPLKLWQGPGCQLPLLHLVYSQDQPATLSMPSLFDLPLMIGLCIRLINTMASCRGASWGCYPALSPQFRNPEKYGSALPLY